MTSQPTSQKTRLLILLMIFAFVVTSADHAEAKKRRRKRKRATKRAAIINEPKLFARIGGQKGVNEIVDEWLRLSFADARVASIYSETTAKPEQIARLRKSWGDELCELSEGCPTRDLEAAKAPRGLTADEPQFLALSENLLKSMEKFNVTEREKNEMLGRLGEAHADLEPDGT